MSIDELYNNISAGQYDSSMPYPSGKRYPEDHVFDEEKSVRWNHEKVAEENKKRQQDLADYRASVRAGEDAFHNDVVSFIETEYGLNKVQTQAVFLWPMSMATVSDLRKFLYMFSRSAALLAI